MYIVLLISFFYICISFFFLFIGTYLLKLYLAGLNANFINKKTKKMKKLLVVLLLTIVSVGAFAQQGTVSGHVKGGLAFDPTRFGVGAEARYGITNEIRGAADVLFFFPKDNVTGLDFNINAHYVFQVADGLDIFPLAGLNIANGRYSASGEMKKWLKAAGQKTSFGSTNFGFNIGAGADYALSEKTYLNAEFKYTFSKGDFAQLMFGYGIRF